MRIEGEPELLNNAHIRRFVARDASKLMGESISSYYVLNTHAQL